MGIQKIAFFGKYNTEDIFEVSVATETEEFGELAREFAGFAVAMGYDPETVGEYVKVDDDVVAECCGKCDEPTDGDYAHAVKPAYSTPQVEFTRDEYAFLRDVISHVAPSQRHCLVQQISGKLEDAGFRFEYASSIKAGVLEAL